MSQSRMPDRTARWISHAAVGFAAGVLVGKKTGTGGLIVGSVAAVLLHEALDAPIAVLLSEAGL